MVSEMYRLPDGRYSWETVFVTALAYPAHTEVIVEPWMVPSQLPDYCHPRIASLTGQKADYGVSLPDRRSIHIKLYDYFFTVHWDIRDPQQDALGHIFYDVLGFK
ncbi:MAG: hypothetical protein ACREA3_02680 [Nitrosotalea sp.]